VLARGRVWLSGLLSHKAEEGKLMNELRRQGRVSTEVGVLIKGKNAAPAGRVGPEWVAREVTVI
jgi:hypothetical protein